MFREGQAIDGVTWRTRVWCANEDRYGNHHSSLCAICSQQVGCHGSPSFSILCHSDTVIWKYERYGNRFSYCTFTITFIQLLHVYYYMLLIKQCYSVAKRYTLSGTDVDYVLVADRLTMQPRNIRSTPSMLCRHWWTSNVIHYRAISGCDRTQWSVRSRLHRCPLCRQCLRRTQHTDLPWCRGTIGGKNVLVKAEGNIDAANPLFITSG